MVGLRFPQAMVLMVPGAILLLKRKRGRRFYAFSQTPLGKRGSPDGEQLHTNASMQYYRGHENT